MYLGLPGERTAIKSKIKRFLLELPGFQELCRRLSRKHIRVLMYHRFEKTGEVRPRHLPSTIFSKQLDYILRHHQVWEPDQQLAAITDSSLLKGKPPVIITIDDGYLDFFEVAFPLLKERALPATLFVTTGFVDGRLWFWWDRLAYLLSEIEPGNRTLEYLDRRISFDSSDPSQKTSAWNTIADYLSIQEDHLKEKAISDLAAACGVKPFPIWRRLVGLLFLKLPRRNMPLSIGTRSGS